MHKEGHKGSVAVVTGGARGIGFASANALAGMGFDIAICSRTGKELEKASEEIRKHGVRCLYQVVDVSKEREVVSFVDSVKRPALRKLFSLARNMSSPIKSWTRSFGLKNRCWFRIRERTIRSSKYIVELEKSTE